MNISGGGGVGTRDGKHHTSSDGGWQIQNGSRGEVWTVVIEATIASVGNGMRRLGLSQRGYGVGTRTCGDGIDSNGLFGRDSGSG